MKQMPDDDRHQNKQKKKKISLTITNNKKKINNKRSLSLKENFLLFVIIIRVWFLVRFLIVLLIVNLMKRCVYTYNMCRCR